MYFTVFCVQLCMCKTILSHSFRKAADTTIINKKENLFIKLTVSHSIHSIKANQSSWYQKLKLVKGEKLVRSNFWIILYLLFTDNLSYKVHTEFIVHTHTYTTQVSINFRRTLMRFYICYTVVNTIVKRDKSI